MDGSHHASAPSRGEGAEHRPHARGWQPDHTRPEPTRLLFDALSSIGGVAALGVAALYLAGLALTTGELWHSQVPVSDALQLLPLESILRAGLTLVLPALLALAILGGLVLASWRFERRIFKHAEVFRKQESQHQPPDTQQQWVTRLMKAEAATDWRTVAGQLKRSLREATEPGRRKPLLQLRKLLRLWTLWSLVIVAFAYAPLALLLPATLSVPALIVLVAAVAAVATKPRPVQQQLLVIYGVVLLVFLLTAVLYPRPLPTAILNTINEGQVKGALVVATDSRWYLGERKGAIRPIADKHVKCAEILAQPRRQTILDYLRGVEPLNPLSVDLACQREKARARGKQAAA